MISHEDTSFRDEQFMTAAEKRLVLAAWRTFLKHGCRLEHFTQKLYHHLMQRCSFIAHHDRFGFFAVYFDTSSESTYRFLDQFDPAKPGISAEYGNSLWLAARMTGSDLNRAMRDAAAPYIAKLRLQFSNAERERDLRMAETLSAKYGKRVSDTLPPDAKTQQPVAELSGGSQEPLASDLRLEQLTIFGNV